MAQSATDNIRKKIKGQLNKYGSRGGMLGSGMIFIKNEDDFIKDLAEILSRRLADIAKEVDLVPVIHEVLMKSRTASNIDLAHRIVDAIQKQK